MRPILTITDLFKDVDECGLFGVCEHGVCNNIDGSYTCTCNEGFKKTINASNYINCTGENQFPWFKNNDYPIYYTYFLSE